MPVKKSIYRRPLTAKGIEKIEKGTMDYFDEDLWNNLNTGTIEQYYNEKTSREGFTNSVWRWKNVVLGVFIGMMFALINQYVGLKVGTIVSGAWYVAYLLGLALRWRPTDINIVAGSATGTAATCTGFVFSYPAIYLLTYSSDYPQLVTPDAIPPIWVAVLAATMGGILGVLYFTIFRRVWVVEDPLPVPGFEASVKLMDMANDISSGAIEHAKRTLRLVFKWGSITALFTFFRDFELLANRKPDLYGNRVHGVWFPQERIPLLDSVFGGRFYQRGELRIPYAGYTALGFEFIPIQIAIGWFMRFKTALLVASGTMFTWFIIIPMAVGFNLPVYIPSEYSFFYLSDIGVIAARGMHGTPFLVYNDASAYIAYAYVARIIAVGAILGGGITALIKMKSVFRSAMSDLPLFEKKDEKAAGGAYVEGLGWHEWPMSHITVMMVLVPIGITVAFVLGGFPFLPSLIFGVLLVAVTFLLGAVGVKTMGETGSTPVSGTSFIVLLILLGVLAALPNISQSDFIVMSIFGASIFGTAITLSSDIIVDFKTGIYAGTRPFHLVKGELTGVVVGTTVAVVGASLFSYGLATGTINLAAPQANAFATLVMSVLGGPNVAMLISFILIGFLIGVVAEITTGMGTAFGLGMYLPLAITLPLIVGGYARDWWAKNRLEPKAKKEKWGEREITLANVDKYMMMTGLIIGEAMIGTIIAMTLIIPLMMGG